MIPKDSSQTIMLDNLLSVGQNKGLTQSLGKLMTPQSLSKVAEKLVDKTTDKTQGTGLTGMGPNGINTIKLPEGTGAGEMIGEFGSVLKGHLQQVNQLSNQAGKLSQAYALGESVPLHQVMVASEKASVAMELTLQIRNKLLQAYQDMMHMPL
jgi:flagellar hook-basal body complex protein FliE